MQEEARLNWESGGSGGSDGGPTRCRARGHAFRTKHELFAHPRGRSGAPSATDVVTGGTRHPTPITFPIARTINNVIINARAFFSFCMIYVRRCSASKYQRGSDQCTSFELRPRVKLNWPPVKLLHFAAD